MPSLKLFLFGSPQIELDGTPVHIATRKALALLVYVAINRQPQTRETLAALFWPESSSKRAFANLRETLRSLKAPLRDHWLTIHRHDIAMNFDSTLWVDILEFQQHLNCVNGHDHTARTLCTDCLQELLDAIDLYRNDFLRGFTLPDSPAFDEWQAFQIDQLREDLIKTLKRVIDYYVSHNVFSQAIDYARRWVAQSPWSEAAHREMMRLYALNDQRSASLQQYRECVRILREEFEAEPEEGTRALYETILHKNLTPRAPLLEGEGEQSSLSLWDGMRENLAPPNNLPAQTTTFIGREAEVTAIKKLLRQSGIRLVTLTGTGGSGKTRLALQLATDVLKDFADGLFFIPLASISNPDLVIPAVIQTLELPLPGNTPPLSFLKTFLQEKRMLLVLDNFEQIISSAPVLIDLLNAASGLKILITSRTVLHLSGEHEYVVPPMALPDPTVLPSFEWLMRSEAIQLFIERARAISSDFILTEDNALSVAEICIRLDGLPLAIELAAARVRFLPPHSMLIRLGSPLQLLTVGPRDLPTRQQTLRKTIEWSYDLLNENEKTLFHRLAVFVGGWTFGAAETICAIDGDIDVLSSLESLVDHNMLTRKRAQKELRFVMLETIREYALERLQEREDVETIRKQHARFFVLFGKEANSHLNRMPLEEHVVWRKRLTNDLDNLRAALTWAIEHAEAWRQAAIELHETLGDLLEFTGQHEEARITYQETLREIPKHNLLWQARLHRKLAKTWEVLNDYDEASRCYDVAATTLDEEQAKIIPDWREEWIEVQIARIWFHYWQNRLEEMIVLTESTRPAIGQYGTPTQRARFFNGLTLMGYKREAYLLSEDTIASSLSAVSASQESDNLSARSMLQFLLGFSYLWGDVLEKADVPLQTALSLAEDIGDVVLQSRCLTYLCILYRRRKQIEDVRAYIPRCLEIAKTAQLYEYVGMATANLSWMALQEKNIEETEANGQAALKLWQQLAPYHCSFKWLALWPLIDVALTQNRIPEAVAYARVLLEPGQKRLPDVLTAVLENVIKCWKGGELEITCTYLDQAMKFAQESGYR